MALFLAIFKKKNLREKIIGAFFGDFWKTLAIFGAARLVTLNLTSDLICVLNKVAPNRTVRIRGESQFVNSKTESVKKKRDRAWKKFKKQVTIHL